VGVVRGALGRVFGFLGVVPSVGGGVGDTSAGAHGAKRGVGVGTREQERAGLVVGSN
jgi:hypothetical protein